MVGTFAPRCVLTFLAVQCHSFKGKVRVRHEFGQKAAVVITNKGNWRVNVEDLPDNPYDGHTLAKSISGAEQNTKVTVREANLSADCRKRGERKFFLFYRTDFADNED